MVVVVGNSLLCCILSDGPGLELATGHQPRKGFRHGVGIDLAVADADRGPGRWLERRLPKA
ncbi:hypothetical protein SAMN04489740_2931 [Arthrobacter alpinus]|uniref:Uncharacterized protein n=1 Tax=Arthrobacter alpinus TaxID=656366 RepID=A0A1H5MG94_9MICC|nr:hypothetical protein SAMN04489740_2931 [Arthrobacter alpinus]